ncbi:MAG: hypothetical protein AAF732_06345 [Pseudomonadota bacterium]
MAFATTLQRRARPAFQSLKKALSEVRRELFDSYHPERHYMRGPGPKCREKERGTQSMTRVPTA